MSVDPRRLFDWYPIEYLEGLERKRADGLDGLGTPATYIPRERWAARVRQRSTWLDADPQTPGWTHPHLVDIEYVIEEMRRRNDGEHIFHWTKDEPDPRERLRQEINAAAEAVAERTD